MIKVMSPNIYNDVIDHWQETMEMFRHNNHTDSISVVLMMESYGILISEVCTVKIIYFDFNEKKLYSMDANDILPFIEERTNHRKQPMDVHESVDILLNIICKKVGVGYLSDLQKVYIDSSMLGFIDKQRYQEQYEYVVSYLKKRE